MGKKRKPDLGIVEDLLWTILSSPLPRDHPDERDQRKVEFPAIERALNILAKHSMKDRMGK